MIYAIVALIGAVAVAIAIGQYLRINEQQAQLDARARTLCNLDTALNDQVEINKAQRDALHDAYSQIRTLRASIPARHADAVGREENWRNQ